jgi:hypothetical protein
MFTGNFSASVIPASLLSRPIDPSRAELRSRLAERVGLTRAVLALALRARCARPKSLQAILSNPRLAGVNYFFR